MHRIKANGRYLLITYQRSGGDIKNKPHICKYSEDKWAIYYLLGKQSRIRCNIFNTLEEAIKQARYIKRYRKC